MSGREDRSKIRPNPGVYYQSRYKNSAQSFRRLTTRSHSTACNRYLTLELEYVSELCREFFEEWVTDGDDNDAETSLRNGGASRDEEVSAYLVNGCMMVSWGRLRLSKLEKSEVDMAQLKLVLGTLFIMSYGEN